MQIIKVFLGEEKEKVATFTVNQEEDTLKVAFTQRAFDSLIPSEWQENGIITNPQSNLAARLRLEKGASANESFIQALKNHLPSSYVIKVRNITPFLTPSVA